MLYSRYPEASLSRDRESNVLFTGRIFFSFSDYEKKRVLVPHEETEGGGTAEGRNVKKWTTTMMTRGVHSGCRMEEVEALDAQAEGHDEGDGGVRVA